MPVLMRGGGGGGKKAGGYSTNTVTIIVSEGVLDKVRLKWSDPEDDILDSVVFAKWAGTTVVRKEEAAPKNEKDGTVVLDSKERNKYKTTEFVDTNVESGKIYYYSLFPYTDKGIYNYSADNVVKVYVAPINPVFAENTWEQIIFACENKVVPETWKIGDAKVWENFTYYNNGNVYTKNITFQIWGKNVDDYADGSGKVPITFGLHKNSVLQFQTAFLGNEGVGGNGGYANSRANQVLNAWIDSFPELMKKSLKSIKIKWGQSGGIGESVAKLFLPAFSNVIAEPCGGEEKVVARYPVFTDNSSRAVASMPTNYGWWLRTYHAGDYYYIVKYNGSVTSQKVTDSNYLRFAFCF